MTTPGHCAECGSRLPADVPPGFCPACALSNALVGTGAPAAAPVAEQPGDWIGRYHLLEKIGEGGCGVVFLAEQNEPLRRRVALKILKPGMDTRQVIARFEAERQALALMDHPGIARVFDAGATEAGRPYFVMELVSGLRITDYCDRTGLSTRARLDLFLRVCQAVQHAHQKGIIHRDLKPSNILVVEQDGVPVPKVIDFGIAKATQQPLTDATLNTAFHQFLGTPAYMSPEQATLGGADIDTRSDIYALGVLLYELLTGHTPFEPRELLHAGFDEMRRVIREKEPTRPSTRLSTLTADDLTIVARRHQTEPPRLIHRVSGDLDWIVMRCLEKDRARRYETADGLALDVRRHLANEPVSAAAPSALYRARKFVGRHRMGLATAAALLVLLVAGVAASVRQAVLAARAGSEAHAVSAFLKDMLEGAGPSVALGRDTKLLREILDKAAVRAAAELKNQPAVEAEVRSTIGNVYGDIGEYVKGEAMHHRALALRMAWFGPEHPKVADSINNLGAVLDDQGKFSEAEVLFRQALALRRKVLGNEHFSVAESLNNLGVVLYAQGKLAEAEPVLRQALAMRRKLFGPEHVDVATSLHNLANILIQQGKWPEAEALLREVAAMRKKLLGSEHPLLATTLGNLGSVLWNENKLPEAETVYRETLAMQRKLLGSEHKDVATSLYNLACLLQKRGQMAEAEALCREALATQKRILTSGHPDTAMSLCGLSAMLQDEGQLPEAEASLREALEMQRKLFPNEHPAIAISLNNLGDVLRLEGRLAEAETVQRESVAMLKKLFGEEHQYVAIGLDTLGKVLRDERKLAESEATHRAALAMRRKLLGNDNPDIADSLNSLADVLRDQDRLAEAEESARACLVIDEKVQPDDWRTFETRSLLGSLLLARKEPAAAEPLLISGFDGMLQRRQTIPTANQRRLPETARELARLFQAAGQPDKAAEWEKRSAEQRSSPTSGEETRQ